MKPSRPILLRILCLISAPAWLATSGLAAEGDASHVSGASGGTQRNSSSEYGPISADRRFLAIPSFANNLVSDDTNGTAGIFVHENDIAPPVVAAILRSSPNPTKTAIELI